MRVEELRALIRAQPFRPFTVHVPDGAGVPVGHPDFTLLAPDGRTLWVYQKDFTCDMLDVMLVSRVSFGPPGEAPSPAPQPGAAG